MMLSLVSSSSSRCVLLMLLGASAVQALRVLPLTQQQNAGLFPPPERRNLQRDDGADNNVVANDSIDELYQGYGIHYVTLQVGCPPQEQTLIVNTGNSKTGFPCSACDLSNCGAEYHLNPFYDENKSSCFTKVDCDNCLVGLSQCTGSFSDQAVDAPYCSIGTYYTEGSSWDGFEAEDLVSTGSGIDAERFYMRFACQTSLTGLFRTQMADGILGMSKDPSSFWSQMNRSGLTEKEGFSLCYNLQEEKTTQAGYMIFDGPDTRLHETTMVYAKDTAEEDGSYYEVKINEISIQKAGATTGYISTLGIDSGSSSQKAEVEAHLGMIEPLSAIVESGTTYVHLSSYLQELFEAAWGQFDTGIPFDSSSYYDLSEEELQELPTILFHLQGASPTKIDSTFSLQQLDKSDEGSVQDVYVALPPSRYLEKKSSGEYGWAIQFDWGTSALGANFMAGHDVMFDIENKRIGFAESPCDYDAVGIPREPPSMINPPVSNPIETELPEQPEKATPNIDGSQSLPDIGLQLPQEDEDRQQQPPHENEDNDEVALTESAPTTSSSSNAVDSLSMSWCFAIATASIASASMPSF